MTYNEFKEITWIDDEDYRLKREAYETQIWIKHRPRKPDVINTVSVNTPYDINVNAKKEQFAKYERDHEVSLRSFSDEDRLDSFMYTRYGYLKKYPYLYDHRYFDTPLDLALYMWCVDHDIDLEFMPVQAAEYRMGDKLITFKFKHIPLLDEGDHPEIEYISEDDVFFETLSQWIYDNYSDDYIPLFKVGLPFPWPNANFRDTSPSGLIRHFHKSIYEANYRNQPCALEVWDNKDVFKKLALNRLYYVGECNPRRMLQGLNIAKEAIKVSVFKSTLAERLITQYLWDAREIFDPFSGFSGRMFGAILNGKPYIGRDVNQKHVDESKQIVNFIKFDPIVSRKYRNIPPIDLQVADAIYSRGCYDTLFTCSPYANINDGKLKNIEEWNNPNQAVLTCDQWIDVCLANYKCRKYLFVVDDTITKYRPYIVGFISNSGHIARNVEFIVYIDFTNYWNGEFTPVSGSQGLTPFDVNTSEEYQYLPGEGVTPFDIN